MAPNKMYPIKQQIRNAVLDSMRNTLRTLNTDEALWTRNELVVRKDLAAAAMEEFRDAHKELICVCTRPEDVVEAMATNEDAAALQLEIMAAFHDWTTVAKAQQPALPSINEIKLQRFNGDPTEWVEWRARFEEKVLTTALTPAQKIDLLLDVLEGEAKTAAGNSSKRDQDELDRIWGKLVLDFDNPYQQVYAHIQSIISLPVFVAPSAIKIRQIINRVSEQMRLLTRYDVNSAHWGSIICVILLNKIDSRSRYLWNTSEERPELPNLDSFFNFLHKRARALEDEHRSALATQAISSLFPSNPTAIKETGRNIGPMVGQRSYSPYMRRDEAKPLFRHNQLRACFACNNPEATHLVAQCSAFLGMNAQQRSEIVSQNRLCYRCLKGRHAIEYCRFNYECSNCKSTAHNSLLCLKTINPRQSN